MNPYAIDFEKEGLEGVKGKLIFMFLKDENGGYGFKSRNLSLHREESDIWFSGSLLYGYGLLSQDGILIKKSGGDVCPLLPQWLVNDKCMFLDVNIEGKSKIDLAINRNDAVINEKLNDLKRKIERIIIDHIERLFSQKHLVNDRDKNMFMEGFFRTFNEYSLCISDFFLERMKKSVIFECSVNGEIKYLKYDALKDRWKYFYLIRETSTFRNNTSEDMEKGMENAYPEDSIIYSVFDEKLPDLFREFSGEHTIVTNKELGFSLDKHLLLPSVKKRDKKEEVSIFTFDGDYKDRFGTLTLGSFQIAPNINHPFIKLINKNMDKIKGEDKRLHEFFIKRLLEMRRYEDYLKPLKGIQRIQKPLLDFYVGKGILSKEEAEGYVLTEKDFCPYDMCEDFLT